MMKVVSYKWLEPMESDNDPQSLKLRFIVQGLIFSGEEEKENQTRSGVP